MQMVRALYAFLGSLLLGPALALAQAAEPIEPYEPYQATRWGVGWLWLAVLAVILVALVAWGLSRDRTHPPGPLTR
ncbi:hypothetical protein JRI60_45165 [Archangium violaceum]|uniref:hypothetical protein n=1 Tax=Archangium violaceum TaxID=83451 RepID=UPI001950A84F|nr:hypothetical protein [Archangium violaceum]QRN96143.1 hypothetical protein JRI60_45165 [Archangium violaceum]